MDYVRNVREVHGDALLACIGHCGRIDLRMRGTADNPRSDTVSFMLQAGSRNAGETGRGFMTAQGDRTLINLTITGVPPWVARPIQLFTYVYAGSCAKRDATPAYALNDTVQVNAQNSVGVSGPFTIAKAVPVPMATLRSECIRDRVAHESRRRKLGHLLRRYEVGRLGSVGARSISPK